MENNSSIKKRVNRVHVSNVVSKKVLIASMANSAPNVVGIPIELKNFAAPEAKIPTGVPPASRSLTVRTATQPIANTASTPSTNIPP